jgi:hypothetical protein
MKKRAALVAAVVTVLGLFTAPAASASCTQPIAGMDGCVETIVCKAAAPADKVFGDGTVNCVM